MDKFLQFLRELVQFLLLAFVFGFLLVFIFGVWAYLNNVCPPHTQDAVYRYFFSPR